MAKAKVGNEDRTSIIWEAPNGKTYSIPAEPKGKTGIDVRGDGHVQTMYREWMKNNPKDKPEKYKKPKEQETFRNEISKYKGKQYLLANNLLEKAIKEVKKHGELSEIWLQFFDADTWKKDSKLIRMFKDNLHFSDSGVLDKMFKE